MVPKPSICAPNWIFTASFDFNVTAASSASVDRGVYGVTNELGDTVVGCAMPVRLAQQNRVKFSLGHTTFGDFLSLVNLANLRLQHVVSLFAYRKYVCALSTPC